MLQSKRYISYVWGDISASEILFLPSIRSIPFRFSILSIRGFLVSHGSYVVSQCVGGSKTVEAAYFCHCSRLIWSDSCINAQKTKVPTGVRTKVSYFYESYQEVDSKCPFWQINALMWSQNSRSWGQLYQPTHPLISIPASSCIWEAFGGRQGEQTDTPWENNPDHIEAWPPGPAQVKHKNADCVVINTLFCMACM